MPTTSIANRVDALDWTAIHASLDAQGWARAPGLFTPEEADAIAALYGEERRFRGRVVMARHGFGRGEYQYFSYPLPPLVHGLRTAAYARLAPLANQWHERMRKAVRFPDDHAEFLDRCHRAGQRLPTPLLLSYGAGDYNCLHRDLYGEHAFPLQMVMLLDRPGEDFEGGEFVMTEQRPRMQSRAMVLPLQKGDAAVFAVHGRPVKGTRGGHQVKMSHGVSQITAGTRRTLGVIFHDAV
jgi:uncharacterized protein